MSAVRYRIIENIGRGGMGEVCLGHDLMLDRPVALKFLASADDALAQLFAEARAAAALDHPFICSIFEVTTLDDRPCIAMEYVSGDTLERRLRRGALPVAECVRMAEEIAEALDAAHRRRVIHGDLKPANVMLTEEHHIKVMDFGLATRLPRPEDPEFRTNRGEARAELRVLRGTPAYMSPEQIRGKVIDRRSDIFAFGILLYEMLSGSNPFVRPGVNAVLEAILRDPVPGLHARLSSDMPPMMDGILARMLEKDPADRYQSVTDIRQELRRVSAQVLTKSMAFGSVIAEPLPRDGYAGVIGRDAERAGLLQALANVTSGRGSMVVLRGDLGLGKTRLMDEALRTARERGCLTLQGRCYEDDGTPPLTPYIEILEAACGLIPAHTLRQLLSPSAPELVKLLPELHQFFPDIQQPLDLPPQLRQRFLFTNVREFLARCSGYMPIIIAIDDLQWADESTLQLTRHLAPHLATLPIVIIIACRDVEAPSAVSAAAFPKLFGRMRAHRGPAGSETVERMLDQLVRDEQARSFRLRPFTEADVRRMLEGLSRDVPPQRVVQGFLDQTGGNPFFIAELFHHLNEEGRLLDGRHRWKRDSQIESMEVPASVRVVLDRRLARIASQTRKVLSAAAVMGRSFELDLLQAVADVDEETLIAALDEAEEARLVKGPSGRQALEWRFAHQLFCETLTHAIPTLRRQRLHLRIATEMERLGERSSRYISDIAHHLYRAGRIAGAERTARALTRAGEAAHAMYATDDAVLHYRRALEVLLEVPAVDSTQLEVRERLADLLALVGDHAGAMEHLFTLAAGHDARGEPIEHARVVRKMGRVRWQTGDRAQATACYQQALKVLAGSSAHLEAAHLYQELGLAAFRMGDNLQAIEWAGRAIECAELELGSPEAVQPETRKAAAAAIAHATNTIGVAFARSGKLEAARERIEQSVATAREMGLIDVACRAYANLGVLYSSVQPERAIEVSLTGLDLASKIGAVSLQSYIYANLAAAYCAVSDGCETEGLQAARTAADLDRRLGQFDHLAVPLIVMAQIYQCQGALQDAQRHYIEALALAEKAGEPQLILPCYDGLATIHLDRGNRIQAAEYMTKARTLYDRTGLDPDSLLLLPFLS